MLIGFAVGLLLLGAAYGAILGDVEEVLDSVDSMRRSAEAMGEMTEAFASMLMTTIATVGSAYVVLAVLRARGEEVSGRAEPLPATGLSRHRRLGGHLTVALLAGPFLLLLAGLGFGFLGSVSADEPSLLPKLVGAALLHSPALWVTAGAAAAAVRPGAPVEHGGVGAADVLVRRRIPRPGARLSGVDEQSVTVRPCPPGAGGVRGVAAARTSDGVCAPAAGIRGARVPPAESGVEIAAVDGSSTRSPQGSSTSGGGS
ncbi:hypothetical protein JGS22_007615 [Streptomyces sp. P38-E01]|uniref:Uncharacterized protein n=1 Tax=Streptomyces tardus TaxID=2780544 RepID=A0A949JFE4_9ACTN|nr:hypothetical protein [Streptomyces tardus]MBU7597494.1 hypothetical protein [Streptomyces tardus]